MPTVIPNQPFGAGDAIYCQTLVKKVANGNPIIWPMFPQFVDGFNRAYGSGKMKFVDWRTIHINYDSKEYYNTNLPGIGDAVIVPIRWTTEIMKLPYDDCMKSKYLYFGMDYNTWIEDAMWERDYKKEEELQNMFPPHSKYSGNG